MVGDAFSEELTLKLRAEGCVIVTSDGPVEGKVFQTDGMARAKVWCQEKLLKDYVGFHYPMCTDVVFFKERVGSRAVLFNMVTIATYGYLDLN